MSFSEIDQKALDAVTRAAQMDSLDDAAGAVRQAIADVLPCDRFDLALAEEGGRRVVIRSVAAAYEPLLVSPGFTADVTGGPFERALVTGEIVTSDPTRQDEEEGDELSSMLSKEGIRTIAILPVACNGPVGYLSCGSRKADAYDEHSRGFLSAVARLLSYRVERAYHAEQIEKNYRAYMEMLGFVSHELKSPLASIITQLRTMADGYYGKLEERQREVLEGVLKKAEYLHAVSEQYLNLARFESHELSLRLRLVDFPEDVIEPAIEMLQPQMDERRVIFERGYGEGVQPVRCDPDLMKIVMINLIGNGIKYGNRGGRLRVSVKRSFKKYEVEVWNEGPGFSEEDKQRLFKKFSRLQATELIERKGSGVGLYVSWRVVMLHGGKIHADSQPGSWARFTVEIPQYPDRP